jgi:hypothetical protein
LGTLLVVVFILVSAVTDTQSTCDSPLVGGHSGAPGSPNCTYCHGGKANTGKGNLTFTLDSNNGQYIPGKSYNAIVTVAQSNLNKFGFVITARDSGNSSIGDFVILDSVNTRKFKDGGEKYFSHTPCGADANPAGSKSWKFQWVAPAVQSGQITFYLSSLAANHDEKTSGDFCYTEIKKLSVSTGINEIAVDDDNVQIFPNPSDDIIYLLFRHKLEDPVISLFNQDGKFIHSLNSAFSSEKIMISKRKLGLIAGIYWLRIQTKQRSIIKKIIFS